MSVSARYELWAASIMSPSLVDLVLIEAGRRLAEEIDVGLVPVAAPTGRLTALIAQIEQGQSRDDDRNQDWSNPVSLAVVRDATKPVKGDVRARAARGRKAVRETVSSVAGVGR